MKILFGILFLLMMNFSFSQTLTLAQNSLDYGKIKKGENGVRKLEVKNTGDKPLMISNVKSTCGCTIPSWPKEPILPGKSEFITINYDTKKEGTISKTIEIFSNDAKGKRKTVRITGYVN